MSKRPTGMLLCFLRLSTANQMSQEISFRSNLQYFEALLKYCTTLRPKMIFSLLNVELTLDFTRL